MSDYVNDGPDPFSMEALEASAVAPTDAQAPDAVDAEAPTQTEETPESEQPVREEPAHVEAGSEEPSGEPEASEEHVEPKKWAGKYDSPEQLEKGHTSYRSYADRKIQEQAQELEALRAAVLSDDEPEPEPDYSQEPISPTERAQLGELVASNPEAAFQWAAQHAPDTLPDVIAATREIHSDVQADRMQANFQAMLVQAQTEQVRAEMQEMMQPMIEQREQAEKDAQFNRAADDFLASVDQSHFEALQTDFAEALAEWGDVIEADPDMAPRAMKAAWAQAQVTGAHKISEGERALADANRQQKLAAQGEVGIPGSAPTPPEQSEESQILNSIFGDENGDFAY